MQEVKKRKGNEGYNVATGEYEDLVKAGVVDPKKVTRSALQNAASIAGLLLTTECLITEIPEKGPGGGGGVIPPKEKKKKTGRGLWGGGVKKEKKKKKFRRSDPMMLSKPESLTPNRSAATW